MHLIVGIRGIKGDVDNFINDMSAKFLPWKAKSKFNVNEPLKDMVVQVSMRPFQLYEIVFPEESRDVVLNTLWPAEAECTDGYFGNVWGKKFKWVIDRIRKLAGLEEIPRDYDKKEYLLVRKNNVEFIGVGIKKDVRIEGQEML